MTATKENKDPSKDEWGSGSGQATISAIQSMV